MTPYSCSAFIGSLIKTVAVICCFPCELLSDNIGNLEHNADFARRFDQQHGISKRSPFESQFVEPTILVLGENNHNPRIGDTVTLHCNVDMPDHSEPLFVKWTFGRTILTHDENVINADVNRFHVVRSQETQEKPIIYTLINSNVIESDFGEYRCVIGYDPYGTGHSSMQMWSKIVVTKPIIKSQRFTLEHFPKPKCTAEGGVLDSNTWLLGQSIVVNCQIDTDISDMVWNWISYPSELVTILTNLRPHTENGTTSMHFQITAHESHAHNIFVCTSTFEGIKQNCTIGPITVQNQEPTLNPLYNSPKSDITDSFRITSGVGSVTRSVEVPVPPNTSNVPVIVVGLFLGLMATTLLMITIFMIWLRKTRPNGFQASKRPKRTVITNTSSTSDFSLPSSPNSTLPSNPKLETRGLESKLSNLEEHKYDVINELNHYDSIQPTKAKTKVRAVPYAITEIQTPQQETADDDIHDIAYATVWRESPDGASVSSEGFVDNIIYATNSPCRNHDNKDVMPETGSVDTDGLDTNDIYE